eukprot:8618641-Ditylum_brightwellii.AAC.1
MDEIPIQPKHQTCAPNTDYLTDFEEWRAVQSGMPNPLHPDGSLCVFNKNLRYIQTGKDLGQLVWQDKVYSIFWRVAAALEIQALPPYNCINKI